MIDFLLDKNDEKFRKTYYFSYQIYCLQILIYTIYSLQQIRFLGNILLIISCLIFYIVLYKFILMIFSCIIKRLKITVYMLGKD